MDGDAARICMKYESLNLCISEEGLAGTQSRLGLSEHLKISGKRAEIDRMTILIRAPFICNDFPVKLFRLSRCLILRHLSEQSKSEQY
jgi:hypothetical protein